MPHGPDEARGRAPDWVSGRAGWSAAALLSAPHKLCFFWAALHWVIAALWWAAWQLAQASGRGWTWQVPPAAAHGLWFSLGAIPLFIAGFMFTAGPRWLRRPPVDARELRLALAMFTAGWALAIVGFHAAALLAATGLGLAAFAWSLLAHRMMRLVTGSTEADRKHAKAIAAAALAMAACLAAAAAAVALALDRADILPRIVQAGLWWGSAVVFVVVSHRMLPFLGEGAWPWLDARWPDWPLWVLASVPVVQGGTALARPWLEALPGWRWLVAVHLALVAGSSLRLSLRWLGSAPVKQPLVAMLFRALLWWDAALCLGVLSWLPAVDAAMASRIGMAALHALTLGFMGGTMLAMVTRVSSTHSGRSQAIDAVARHLHSLLQATVIARLAAALWPESVAILLPAAAAGWFAIAVVWTLRHGRWLGQPRADGRPG